MAVSVMRTPVSAPPAPRKEPCLQRARSRTDQRELLRTILEFIERGRPSVLATVLQTAGSTPTKAGSMAVIAGGQVVAGTVGGGAVEAWSEHGASGVLQSGSPEVLTVSLQGGDVGEPDPICGGVMRVLLDPKPARHAAAYAEALEAASRRERGLLLTTVRGRVPGSSTTEWLAEAEVDSRAAGLGLGCLRECLVEERAKLFLLNAGPGADRLEVLATPVIRRPLLVVVGGGHVGQAVAAQAHLVGFEIVVVEDRIEFAREGLFPSGTSIKSGSTAGELAAMRLDQDTFVVLVTRGHRSDAEALEACFRRPVAYLGMIGSQRKIRMLREEWVESGRATAEEFERVYAPIGLDLGAVTVPEIACSIVAQLIAVRRKGAAARLPST